MQLTLTAGCLIKFCMQLTSMIFLSNYYSLLLSPFLQIGTAIDSYHSSGNSFLFQIPVLCLRISEWIVLHTALINSAGIRSIPGDMHLFVFSIAISTPKALSSGTSGSFVCISVYLTSLTPGTFNSWEKWFLHLAKNNVGICNQISPHIFTMLILSW